MIPPRVGLEAVCLSPDSASGSVKCREEREGKNPRDWTPTVSLIAGATVLLGGAFLVAEARLVMRGVTLELPTIKGARPRIHSARPHTIIRVRVDEYTDIWRRGHLFLGTVLIISPMGNALRQFVSHDTSLIGRT